MKSLNVLAVIPPFNRSVRHTDPECLRLIREVDPRIKVEDGSALLAAEFKGDASRRDELDALLKGTDVMFCLFAPSNTISRAPNLKWIQVISAGVDRWRDTDVWQSPVTITGVSGIHATPIGEFVLALMLMSAKNAPLSFKMMRTRRWERYPTQTLRGKSVGIVGLGHIGGEIARLSKAFGMRVLATRRSTKQPCRAKNVDCLLPPGFLKNLLEESDYVVLCLPLTPETRHIIGDAEFKAMKSTAFLINIGRGSLVDEEALVRALDEKCIAGAGLDVTETEPLPGTSRLWNFENVILSPHISGGMENYLLRATDIFCENLRRYLTGKRLINVVDRIRGY